VTAHTRQATGLSGGLPRRNAPVPEAEVAGRLFFAVPLADALREELRAHLAGLTGDAVLPGRAVVAANWHLTLRFIGTTRNRELDQLMAVLEASDLGAAFTLAFGGYGAFPSARRAAVVWLGVTSGHTEMSRIAGVLETAVTRSGMPASDKPFSAHLTLSRLREKGDVSGFVEGAAPFAGTQEVTQVVLYRSFLGGGPPRYEALERLRLD
jgi:2'-5' RNA ligase